MIPVRPILPCLLLLASLACRSSPGISAAPPESQTGIDLFVDPAASLSVEPKMPLAELLERYATQMGWSLLASDPLREKLAAQQCDFTERIEVHGTVVHTFVESLVSVNGLLLRFEHTSAPVVLQVVDPEDAAQGDTPANRVLVPPSELPRWESHPAHMITTQLPLPPGDAELLIRSLRSVLGEAARGVVTKTGETNSVLLSGSGADVARIARVLDQAARGPGAAGALPPAPIEDSRCIGLLRAPPTGLHLEAPKRGDLKLKDMVEAYAQRMGWHLVAGPDTWRELKALNCGFTLPVDVPAESVHGFVEAVLRANDLVMSFAHSADPVLLQLSSTNVAGQNNPRSRSLLVTAAEVPRWGTHPDFLVSTILDLPGIDVRTLSNSLRQMFSDQQTQQIIPIGNTNGLLLTGFGSDVALLTQSLDTLASAAGRMHVPPPPAGARRSALELLAPPAKGLDLANGADGYLTLAQMFEQYAQLMGWRLLVGPDTRNQLRTLKLGLALPVQIPPENVHRFVESIARSYDFVMSFAHAQDPVLLEIVSTNVAGRGNARKDAEIVPVAELPSWADHPDILITTLFDLPGVDVRTLSNSMRQMFSDQQTQQIIPVGNPDSLIVTGFGAEVAAVAELLRPLVDAAAGAHVPVPKIAGGASGLELLVTPASALHLEATAGGKFVLADLVEAYAKLMGWRVLVAEFETSKELKRQDCELTLPVDIQPESVHAFVEGVARAHGLVFGFTSLQAPSVLSVNSTNVAGRDTLRRNAPTVPLGELARWAAHPAFLISATVDLPGVDVRTLSNSLRVTFTDQRTQQIIPLGNTDGMILTGFADEVARLATALGELSRGGAGLQVSSIPPPPAADRARLFPLGETSFSIAASNGLEAAPIEVLEAFASWTKRPLEISDDARKVLAELERGFAQPRVIPAPLVYSCVGALLGRARCTLSPVPADAPTKWVVDLARNGIRVATIDVPLIPFEELAAWSAYCATPFRTLLKLPAGADAKQVEGVVKIVSTGEPGCRVLVVGNGAMQLCGTPLEIQVTAYTILRSFDPVPEKPR